MDPPCSEAKCFGLADDLRLLMHLADEVAVTLQPCCPGHCFCTGRVGNPYEAAPIVTKTENFCWNVMANFHVANSLSVVRTLWVLVPVSLFATTVAKGLALHQPDLLLLGGVVGFALRFFRIAITIATGLSLLLVPFFCTLVRSISNRHIFRHAILEVGPFIVRQAAAGGVGDMCSMRPLASPIFPRFPLTPIM